MNAAIEVRALTKAFGARAVVSEVTFDVARGELFGLVGPDGAGKTTTLRMLASVMEPTAGDAWVAGRHVVREAEEVRRRIGYMSQRFGLYPDLTVRENIDFYADIYGVVGRERGERVQRLLAWSDLAPFTRRLAGRLSGGMKQKLGLVCALVHTPEVLLLDEPTNGVDPVARREFWRILNDLVGQGVTVVASTAYLDEAERFTRLALMHRGRVVAVDAPDAVKRMVRGSVVEIPTGEARRHAGALRERFGPRAVGMFGDRVHVVLPGADALDRVRAALAEAGLESSLARVAEPALEDIFVSVLGDDGDD